MTQLSYAAAGVSIDAGDELVERIKPAAKKTMIETISMVIDRDFPGCTLDDFHMAAAYTGTREEAQEWLDELHEAFPGREIHMDPLSLSVACHIGPGSRAVAINKKLDI